METIHTLRIITAYITTFTLLHAAESQQPATKKLTGIEILQQLGTIISVTQPKNVPLDQRGQTTNT